MVQAVNPRTGASFGPDFADTSAAEIDVILTQSLTAFERWSSASCAVRADVLDSVAVSIDSQAASLVEIADLETGLGVPRLTGEVGRTTFQIREFAKSEPASSSHLKLMPRLKVRHHWDTKVLFEASSP
jgi:NADP-dependent aldehyde dehydrogenase